MKTSTIILMVAVGLLFVGSIFEVKSVLLASSALSIVSMITVVVERK